MNSSKSISLLLLLAALIVPIALFVGATLPLEGISEYFWLFTLPAGLSTISIVLIATLSFAGGIVAYFRPSVLEYFGKSFSRLTLLGLLLGVLLIITCGNRSVLFGSANLLIGQIRQLPNLPLDWTWGVDQLYFAVTRLLMSFGLRDDQGAYWAVRSVSVLGTLCSIPALTRMIAERVALASDRVALLFLILIPCLPFLTGLPVREAIMMPVISWTLWLAVYPQKTIQHYIFLLIAFTFGCWLHPWALFLAPVVLVGLLPIAPRIQMIIGVVSFALLLIWIRSLGSTDILAGLSLQPLTQPASLGADWILGGRHLLLWLQLGLLAVPLVFFAAVSWFARSGNTAKSHSISAVFIVAAISGFVFAFSIRLPQLSFLDWPRLLPFLLPTAILFLLWVEELNKNRSEISRRAFFVCAPFLLISSLLWIKPLNHPADGEDFVVNMANQDEPRWVAVGFGLRDSYFLERQFEEATNWENQLANRSSDYLTWKGCYDLIAIGKFSDVVLELNQVLINQPTWGDPRAMLALAYARSGNAIAARAHLDTVLALFPYDRQLLKNRYSVEMETNNLREVEPLIYSARRLYPDNVDIQTDQMILAGRFGRAGEAVARADSMLAANPTYAAAMRIRGMVAEKTGDLQAAIQWYQKYTESERDGAQIAVIRDKINQLTVLLTDSQPQSPSPTSDPKP